MRTPPARSMLAAAVLAAARAIVAARMEAGADDAAFDADELARHIEAGAESRALLDAAVAAAVPADAAWIARPSDGARARRVDRAAEVWEAIAVLRLSGEVIPDGPERLTLPGWGPCTRRAVRALRTRRDTAAWEAQVARVPVADLGDAAPAWLRGLPLDASLSAAAAELLVVEAHRQDVRDALLTTAARLARALDRGREQSARALEDELGRLSIALTELDEMAATRWEAGLAMAGAGR